MKEIIWLFGLSGSGKTTIGSVLFNAYKKQYPHQPISFLDGDKMRRFISRDLGYSYEDRCKNIRRVSFLARELMAVDVRVIACFTTPFKVNRLFLKNFFRDNIKLIWCKCSIEKCIERDTKGLYSEALMGDIKNMVGIDLPFEKPGGLEYYTNIDTDIVGIKDCYTYLAGELELNVKFEDL